MKVHTVTMKSLRGSGAEWRALADHLDEFPDSKRWCIEQADKCRDGFQRFDLFYGNEEAGEYSWFKQAADAAGIEIEDE